MTYHAYEKALSIIREVGKRKEYFHPCREDKVVLLMMVNMPERLTLLTSRYSKVIINTEELHALIIPVNILILYI